MRIYVIVFCLLLLNGGCPINDLTKPKPVEIDGLGSLQANSQKSLKEEELTKIVETVVKQKRVGDEDARAMLEIYKRQMEYFVRASAFAEKSENHLEKHDVEEYLGLILQHENLREEARRVTEERIIDALAGWISFDESDEKGMSGAAASLAAAYHNAYNEAVAKDDKQLREENFGKTHAANNASVVAAFERAARQFLGGQRQASPKQKENAEKFVEALEIYNESLPENEKILDRNGRLIDLSAANALQKARMTDIFGKIARADSDPNATALDKALNLLNNRMKPTFSELRDATNSQIRR
jgi:hypothetical protein